MPVEDHLIHTVPEAWTALRPVLDKLPRRDVVVAVDLEGKLEQGDISLVQVLVPDASSEGDVCLLFDTHLEPALLGETSPLVALLRSAAIRKVMHGAGHDVNALRERNVQVAGVYDTQVAYTLLHPGSVVSLNQLLLQVVGAHATNKFKDAVKPLFRTGRNVFAARPLSRLLINYAVCDVAYLVPAHRALIAAGATPDRLLGPLQGKKDRRTRRADTALNFERVLVGDAELRKRCQDRSLFSREYTKWRSQTPGAVGSPADMLNALKRRRVVRVAGTVIAFSSDVGGTPRNRQNVATSGRAVFNIRQAREDVAKKRGELEQNKHGVVVSKLDMDKSDRGDPVVVPKGAAHEQRVTVSLEAGSRPVIFEGCDFTIRQDVFRVQLVPAGSRGTAAFPIELRGGSRPTSATLVVRCEPCDVGMVRSVLDFRFSAGGSVGSFSVSRFVSVRCGDSDIEDLLKPTAPYQKKRRRRLPRPRDGVVMEGPSLGVSRGGFLKQLPRCPVPTPLRRALGSKETAKDALSPARDNFVTSSEEVQASREAMRHYAALFQLLMWTEEAQMDIDILTFSMDAAKLVPRGQTFLALRVPGLVESRPSVLRGDKVIARLPGDGRTFTGYAYGVEKEDVVLKFHPAFHAAFVTDMGVSIEFTYRKTPLMLAHQGLTMAASAVPYRLMFPCHPLGVMPPPQFRSIEPFNRRLNEQQLQAVLAVINRRHGFEPYIIFGPPGTGKTMTMVEAILQVRKMYPHGDKILVCAPSNTAADVLAERLAKTVGSDEMFRMQAFSRNPADLPVSLQRYVLFGREEGGYVLPPIENLAAYRIIVATCSTAAKLHNHGYFDRATFRFMFVDEAGHAWEPEIMAALAPVCRKDGEEAPALVLSGDPRQLGPITRSAAALQYGLGCSMLERLMARPVYQRGPDGSFDSTRLTKLLRNYRSHPAILRVPNKCFYDDELIAHGDPVLTHSLAGWEELPAPNFPLIWHGVEGEDMRESNSPSWFNPAEATQVLEYVRLLCTFGGRGVRVTPGDIGVVTPYAKQAHKLRLVFRAHGFEDIMCGSVEKFQGQERRVIIISTVRSSAEHVSSDLVHNIGFLSNPKRFNVAITRAQALLIVVGNPKVLGSDEHWSKLLWQCVDGGSFVGSTALLPPRDNGMAQTSEAMADLALEEANGDDDRSGDGEWVTVSAAEDFEHAAWRDE